MLDRILHVLRIILDPTPTKQGFVAGILGGVFGYAMLLGGAGRWDALIAGALIALITYYVALRSVER